MTHMTQREILCSCLWCSTRAYRAFCLRRAGWTLRLCPLSARWLGQALVQQEASLESDSFHARHALFPQSACASHHGHGLRKTLGFPSQANKRQDSHDDDNQTDEINDAVHLISPDRGLVIETHGHGEPNLLVPVGFKND